jgi:hypothetical protein
MPRLFALLLLPFLASPLFAGPTADVMRLVPPQTTVCFVLQDLRGNAARLGESPFAAKFAGSKLGKGLLGSDEMKQLLAADEMLRKSLGVSGADLLDQVFGDVVVYAYQPPPDGKADHDAGVVLGKAAKPDALAKLAAKLNAAQIKSKELTGTADKTHNGVGYVERRKADGRTEYYLLREDGTFAYTVQEAVLKQVIDRLSGADKSPSPLAGAIDKLGAADAVVVLLFEPKAFAADLAAEEKKAEDANQKAFLKQFAKLWTAAEAVGVSLTLDTGATLAVTVAAAPDQVPAELRGLFNPDDKPSAVWAAAPSDALLVVGGKFEWDKITALVGSFLADDGKAGLKAFSDDLLGPVVGKDALPKVKAGLGPDWAAWLTAPAKGDAGVLPTATLAMRVRPAGGDDDAVGQAVVGAFDAVLHLFRVDYNRTHPDQFTLREEKADGGAVRYLKNDTALPAGVRPAYGLRGDYFVLGSSVAAVKGFTPPKSDAAVTDAPLVRLNAGKLAEYLTTHGGELAGVLAGWTGTTADKAKTDLSDFAAVLELFDALELHHTGDGKKMTLAIKAKTAKPLKK